MALLFTLCIFARPFTMMARHYLISGLVQGVGFRYFAVRAAERQGIVGSVRNLPNGRVEIVAQGGQERLAAFRRELEQGPRQARVTEVQESELEPVAQFTHFSVEF